MFTGIIEAAGTVEDIRPNGSGLDIFISSSLSGSLKIDQSISHNGVCLTVVGIDEPVYKVTAIAETLQRTNLGMLKIGDRVNLERSMVMNGRIDGHMVQGHVDTIAMCASIQNRSGSWEFRFEYPDQYDNLIVEKGSICVNGVSLTVVNSDKGSFSVAVIPYTFEHTNFKYLLNGSQVNLEFDILGKYVLKALGKL
jgi:riboflavin synthase